MIRIFPLCDPVLHVQYGSCDACTEEVDSQFEEELWDATFEEEFELEVEEV